MPVAPEYRATPAEFEDPIEYIFKMENQASKFGLCKIIPPFPPSKFKGQRVFVEVYEGGDTGSYFAYGLSCHAF
jgi:hypothetical protein